MGLLIPSEPSSVSQFRLFLTFFLLFCILLLILFRFLRFSRLFKVYSLNLILEVIFDLSLRNLRRALSPSAKIVNLNDLRLIDWSSQDAPVVFFVSSDLSELILSGDLLPRLVVIYIILYFVIII